MKAIRYKVELLAKGLRISNKALKNFGSPFLEKRRAYGNPDPHDIRSTPIPQELYILPDNLIVSININYRSEWLLDYDGSIFFITDGKNICEVTFTVKPDFYDFLLPNGKPLSTVATLYGGKSLGIFVYGRCFLADINQACHFCSIKPNRDKINDIENIINPGLAFDAINLALSGNSIQFDQVMINGGNFKDQNKSFLYYLDIINNASKALSINNSNIDLHLIVFPPEDLNLLNTMNQSNNYSIAINTEVFDPDLFEIRIPGKHLLYGREKIFEALFKAKNILGKGRVFSILVGGLEPIDSLQKGLEYLAENGITPIINVLHIDPDTPLESMQRLDPVFIMEMGAALQEVFVKYNLKPFYRNCGRNSIDDEAHKQLFY